ncbi:hypothetical protein SIN8267_02499 [Sinobacterium norvegicum]|uniref:Uncharacterized protein n=2 Tax=Sinobacterium norvegicum TaxID=1641715 RepID=A0ABN8EKX4_9GAMM|nr:hypothetical protein SIN8267_02499 [Sinobacterium norvegicum]
MAANSLTYSLLPTLVLTLTIAVSQTTNSAEIDSYTGRHLLTEDAQIALNQELNRRFKFGIAGANQAMAEAQTGCDTDKLYQQLRYAFAGNKDALVGNDIVSQLSDDSNIPSVIVQRPDSVYRDISLISGIDLYTGGLGAIIDINGNIIGVDKIGHFLAQGWDYFQAIEVEGGSLDEAMQWGEKTEASYYGLWTTGLFSHADLTANFNGYRFWLALLSPDRDPLNATASAYLHCDNQQWLINRPLDIADYIDGAWDEANNCLDFASDAIADGVQHNIDALQLTREQSTCPIKPQRCQLAVKKYGDYSAMLLHPRCQHAVSPD